MFSLAGVQGASVAICLLAVSWHAIERCSWNLLAQSVEAAALSGLAGAQWPGTCNSARVPVQHAWVWPVPAQTQRAWCQEQCTILIMMLPGVHKDEAHSA